MRLQPKAGRARRKSHPPHSMCSGAVDENRRCKRQYSKELRQTHPLLKCLSSGAVDTGPITPPHTHSNGPPDEIGRCKCLYPKDLRHTHPQLKYLSCGAVDTGPMSPPTYYGQRDNGCARSMQTPIFEGVFERSSVVQPLGQRDNGGIPCVCVGAQCNPFSCPRLSQVDTALQTP